MKKFIYILIILSLLTGCAGRPNFDQVRIALQYSSTLLRSPDGAKVWGVVEANSQYIWGLVKIVENAGTEYIAHGYFRNMQEAESYAKYLQGLGWGIIFFSELIPEVALSIILQILSRMMFIFMPYVNTRKVTLNISAYPAP